MSEPKQEYKIDGRPATIFRTVKNKDNPYVMIDRRPIDNPKLSFKAKGILTYLMSRPDGWEVSVTDLVRHGIDGEAAIRSGLKELREAGHMKYTVSRRHGRITGWLIEVYEVPSAEFANTSPDSGFLQVENLQVENLQVENRTQVLSTLSSNESNKEIGVTPEKRSQKPDLVDGMIAFSQSPAIKKELAIDEIKTTVRVQLAMRPTGREFDDFCAAVLEERKQGHELKDFIDWWILNGGQRQFWSFKRMATMYPMAFRAPAAAVAAPIVQASSAPAPQMSREDAEKVAKARQAARAALGVR